MAELISWLQSAPSGALALVTALLSAVVAVVIVMLTQWILGRRSRTELLTKKLEELYLSLNQAASDNVSGFETVVALANYKPTTYGQKKQKVDLAAAYALDLHKKIVMYVRLYFPLLSAAHQHVFNLNRDVNKIIHGLTNGEHADEQEIHRAFVGFGESLRIMEQEIIDNRQLLVRDYVLPRRYKRVPNPAVEGTLRDKAAQRPSP